MASPTCTRTSRRIPRHQRHAVRSAQVFGRRESPLHRCGRRRPVDLWLAWRHTRQLTPLATRLSCTQSHQARAKLPFHQRDFAGRQSSDCGQPQAVSQNFVFRIGRRRTGARGRRRQRRARGRTRGGAHSISAQWRRSHCGPAAQRVARLRSALPRQPPSARLGKGFSQSANSVQGIWRSKFF